MTGEPLIQLEGITNPAQRLGALFKLVANEVQSHVIYSELLKALDNPAVQPVIGRVSKRRLDYLTSAFRAAGLDAGQRAAPDLLRRTPRSVGGGGAVAQPAHPGLGALPVRGTASGPSRRRVGQHLLAALGRRGGGRDRAVWG